MSVIHPQENVTIIGGGIIGCSAAYFLAVNGMKPLLLERGALGAQASGVNAGTISIQNKTGKLFPLAIESVRLWQELSENAGLAAEFENKGGLRVAVAEAEVSKIRRSYKEMRNAGVAAEYLEPQDIPQWCGQPLGEVIAATYCERDSQANPRLAVLSMAQLASLAGARLVTGAKVIDLESLGDTKFRVGFELEGGTKTLESAYVVNAAGVWSPDVAALLGHTVPLTLLVQQAMVTAKASRCLSKVIVHAGGRLSLKQMRDGSILIGGGWPGITDETKSTRGLIYESMMGNAALAVRVLPWLSKMSLLRVWCGLEVETEDRLPIIGPAADSAGFFYAVSGFGGFVLGPLIGRLVSEYIVEGGCPPLAKDCRLSRLKGAS
jgi:glycine/D-amino acid oxidase-like deaminating enzyme